MKKIAIITILVALFVGCGSGGSGEETPTDENVSQEHNITQESNTTGYVEDYTETLTYNYNQDESAIQELLPLYVNQYEVVQNRLDRLQSDEEAFDNYYEWYVSQLVSTQRAIDSHPSYAPRGQSKSLIVNVTNGEIDYGHYKLIGDIDHNGEVDFDDEQQLKEALANGFSDTQYDLNGDGNIDTKDIIDLLARIGTEIKSFDFYTLQGEKLEIPSRSFSDTRLIRYTGSEQQVMVVAKDRNGVSGFTTGLSDMDQLWYVGVSTEKQQRIIHKEEEGLDATNPEKIAFVREALAFLGEEEPQKYLLGWKISIKFNTNDGLDRYGLEDMDTFYFSRLEEKINPHFRDTNMGNPTNRVLEKGRYLYHIGAGRYTVEESADIKHSFDLSIGSFESHVKSLRKTLAYSTRINGQTVTIKTVAHASSVVFTSKADKTLEGKITKEGEEVTGKHLKAKRIGPDPQEESYESNLEDSTYTLENIPFGAYELRYEDPCGCQQLLEDKFVFKKERSKDLSIDKQEVTVKLTIRDSDNDLLIGKNIRLESELCMEEEKSFVDISDDEAKVKFENVPIGKYKIYVEDKESRVIQVCDHFDGEALGEQLWDINISHRGNNVGNWNWTKIKIGLPDDPTVSSEEFYNFMLDPENRDKQPPFPYDLSSPLENRIVLTDTSVFPSNTYNESFELRYQYDHYCIWYDFFINDDGLNMPAVYCRDSDFPIYNDLGYDGRLTSSEIASLRAYEKFTIIREGSDPVGFVDGVFQKVPATLTITFTPN